MQINLLLKQRYSGSYINYWGIKSKNVLLTLGLPGIWFIVVSAMALNNKEIPNILIMLGFIWGVGNILTAIAQAFLSQRVVYCCGCYSGCCSCLGVDGGFLLTVVTKLTN